MGRPVTATIPDVHELVTPGNLGDELFAFLRAMRAEHLSESTIYAYGGAVVGFGQWLMDHDYPTDIERIEARHIEEWIGHLLETRAPATAHQRWRGIQRFFNWYASRDDDFRSPMRKLRPPRLPRRHPRVLELDAVRAVLATCQGKGFEDRRDNALIRLLFDTGSRRHEIAGLRVAEDVDLRRGTIHYVGKGDKDNTVPFGDQTAIALEDYLRARRRHDHAALPWLWLGRKGQLTDSGIAQALRTRGLRVGIPALHAHDFRSTATHYELQAGMSESDVMAKRGWDSPAMLRRYAGSTANARMIESSRKLALGDKL